MVQDFFLKGIVKGKDHQETTKAKIENLKRLSKRLEAEHGLIMKVDFILDAEKLLIKRL
jgi:hypothetical protein